MNILKLYKYKVTWNVSDGTKMSPVGDMIDMDSTEM